MISFDIAIDVENKNSEKVTLMKFSIMSYNVLAQRLINRKVFGYVPEGTDILKKKPRRLRLLNQIQNAEADIICLQEMDQYSEYFCHELGKLG